MTRATMLASTTAEPIAQPEITTPQPTAATRKRRNAVDARHSRGSSGARERPCAQDGCLARPMGGGIRSAEMRCRKTQYVHAWYTTVSGAMNAVTHVMILRV